MKPIKITLVLLSFVCGIASASSTDNEWVDLSHRYSSNTVYWPTSERFQLDKIFVGETDQGFFYSAFKFSTAEHGGTHIDAPYHFYKQGNTVDNIPLNKLIGQAVVTNFSKQASKNRDYLITVKDFQHWEAAHGKIPKESIVLIRTGYENYWPDAKKYLGTKLRGEKGVSQLHFPGLSEAAAKWLVTQRKIKAVGIDTASIDYGQSNMYKAHRVLTAASTPIFENVNNLSRLPATNVWVVALPMKIKGGSGGPLRIIAKKYNSGMVASS